MKVIVFGATGTIGQNLVEQALEQGHQVTAFCRNPEKLNNKDHHNLTISIGDVLDESKVKTAISGQEVVCIALGSGKKRSSTIRSVGTKNIIGAMNACGVKRLICQSTLGTGESNNNLNFFWKHIMFGWYLKKIFIDHELQEKYVRESNLDWTIVKPGAFAKGGLTQTYRHGFSSDDRSLKLKISPADVAHFLIQQFTSKSYLNQSPGLSY